MSNVKRSYNTSRRIRKGCKFERLIRFVLMRPLRTKTKVLADEYIIENPFIKKMEQEINIISNLFKNINLNLFLSILMCCLFCLL